ncbi:MAG: ATP synthase subunit I [Deltaproteobacteria bacterium]|nr:ATP synthase subunit I [Deltaproteobacteria bacterium]
MTDDTHDLEFKAAGLAAGRAGLVNLVIGATALVYGFATGVNLIVGLAVGFLVGALNMAWLMRILRRGINLEPQKAAGSVARGYYIRFLSTALAFFVVISRGWCNPWQLIIGFSLAVFSVIAILAVVASGVINTRAGTDRALKNESKQEG